MSNLFNFAANIARAQQKDNPYTSPGSPLARETDPMTSHEAAEKMVKSGELSRQEDWIYNEIVEYIKYRAFANLSSDFTTKDIAAFISSFNCSRDKAYDICRKRFSGLHNKGKIELTGSRRDGCRVWRLL